MMRMASCNDFLGQHPPIRDRSLRVAVIMQVIARIAFFTVQGTAGIMHQPDLGRAGTDFDCFRMHASDYATCPIAGVKGGANVDHWSGVKLDQRIG